MATAMVGRFGLVTMEDTTKFAIHDEPVWRDRSNFIIHAELEEGDRPHEFEQLWAKQLGDDEFEICCIPFFVFDISLGDVVRTEPQRGRKYVVKEVTRPSGHYTFRAWFGESYYPRDDIATQLTAMGLLIEWSSVNLLAVDASDFEAAQRAADFLQHEQDLGHLLFETGKS